MVGRWGGGKGGFSNTYFIFLRKPKKRCIYDSAHSWLWFRANLAWVATSHGQLTWKEDTTYADSDIESTWKWWFIPGFVRRKCQCFCFGGESAENNYQNNIQYLNFWIVFPALFTRQARPSFPSPSLMWGQRLLVKFSAHHSPSWYYALAPLE